MRRARRGISSVIVGEYEAPVESSIPAPEDALASSSSRKGTPPIRTSSLSERRVSGSIEAERDTDHFLRASIPRRKRSTAASTDDGSSSAREALKWRFALSSRPVR